MNPFLKNLTIGLLTFGLPGGLLFAQEAAPKPLELLLQTLSRIENPEAQANILLGANTSLKGRHGLTPPATWDALYEKLKTSPNEEVRRQARALAVTFGGDSALEEMRKIVTDTSGETSVRQAAIESLLAAKDAKTLPILLDLIKATGPLRAAALRGLATYDDPQIAGAVLAVFPPLNTAEKRDGLNTLLARPASAQAFLAAIDAGTLQRTEITAPTARQLQDLHDSQVDAWLNKNWGAVRTSPADKQKQIAGLKAFVTPRSILAADASRGRAIFNQTCAICHTIFGSGAKIGPELPGSFEDIDYLLLNIVDPNAIIGKDYQQVLIQTKDGQTLSGIIASEDTSAVTLKSLAGVVTVQRADIASLEVSPNSLMPEGLITSMDEESVRDLFLYLRQRAQVPMLATPVNAADFFNGNDLARWSPSGADEWKVEQSEIVGHARDGKTAALLSSTVADDYSLTFQVQLTGADAVAELAFRGALEPGKYKGFSLSFGGTTPANVWRYDGTPKPAPVFGPMAVPTGQWAECRIDSHAREVKLTLNGQTVFQAVDAPVGHNGFGFFLRGKDATLRVKNVKLEIVQK